jgi:acetyl-CoA C-acetyltransferase
MNKWTRGVSIIGAAYSHFGNVLETPEIKGMTYWELLATAALGALENAGITPKDVDSLLVNQVQTQTVQTLTTNAVAAHWLGMTQKPSVRYETACSSGASGIRLAGSMIASGIDDIVLIVGAEILNSVGVEKENEFRKQPGIRQPIDRHYQSEIIMDCWDQAYIQPLTLGGTGITSPLFAYADRYGVTFDQLDEARNAAAINLRRNAARNPKAMLRTEYKDIAKEAGFSDEREYLRSPQFNPFVNTITRISQFYVPADGAAALVLCASEDAKKYTKTPVDVIGIGAASGSPYSTDPYALPPETSAFDQAYKMANLNPKDIDYLGLHDVLVEQHIYTSEKAGYFEPGESWRAIIEGRTAFDGDKPINTHGGCPSMGNVYGISGITEIGEAVLQMKGECGDRQIRPPKIAVTHAMGGGPSYGVTVLQRRD